MKIAIITVLLATTFVSTVNAQVNPKVHSKTIVVEPPSTLPQLARNGGAAIYLHNTSDGRTFLYIEENSGQSLSILNVTDPAAIKGVAQVPIGASAPFDFVRNLDASTVLIRYRDHSGFAVLNFRKYDRPVLSESPQLAAAGAAEKLGTTGLLLTSANDVLLQPARALQNYDVVDTSNPSRPVLLATVSGVKQRLSRTDTGTLFLLSEDGVTIVRLLQVEEEHAIRLMQQSGN